MPIPFFISAIIPTYNGEAYLEEAVNSILAQRYESLEIIIVDDGSTDDTSRIAGSYGDCVYYYYQSNQGVAVACNRGLSLAQGDMIAFLDQDDLWPADKLAVQFPRFVEYPTLDVLFVRIQCKKLVDLPGSEPAFKNTDGPVSFVNLGCGLFKKTVFDRVGKLDETIGSADDIDWVLRALEKNVSIRRQEEVVLYYRMHDRNQSLDNDTCNTNFLKAVKKSLDRRRRLNDEMITRIPVIPGVTQTVKHVPELAETCHL